MPSAFTWLDFAESDRQKAMQVIDLFREKGTVDELGFAPIRDAFADHLFPGTSTIQTRARYFLFVPWIMQRFKRRALTVPEFAQKVRGNARRGRVWGDLAPPRPRGARRVSSDAAQRIRRRGCISGDVSRSREQGEHHPEGVIAGKLAARRRLSNGLQSTDRIRPPPET